MRRNLILAILSMLLIPGGLRAEILDSSSVGFTVRSKAVIAADSDRVYAAFIHDVGRWWNPRHTWSGSSSNLAIDAKAGGFFSEQLPGGGSVRHLTVVYVEPGRTIRMEGGLGPLQSLGVAGSMTWVFARGDHGTNVEVTYAVGGYRPGGLGSFSPVVDRVLGEQLLRLKNYIEKGKPE